MGSGGGAQVRLQGLCRADGAGYDTSAHQPHPRSKHQTGIGARVQECECQEGETEG